ncbi:4Fe-4S binding protein [Proteinivorax hydrogeniformans]|uniref:4Fe-4S binding protein n=1 Tax=Proteinivorax hydrogeniformans TaxID=1826727 RepID=A0AAU8HV93_9FIRM
MTRQIIKIDEDKCIGCKQCVSACQEGAIGMVDGKAKLLRDDYCDGLGNCLPVCPTNAISFEEREASAFAEDTTKKKDENKRSENLACGCPGTHSKTLKRGSISETKEEDSTLVQNQLNQWPVQIKLVPPNAPYFEDAHLLIAADCTAFAYGNFHKKFMKNKITLIGCPKLDEGDYSEKITTILRSNNIKSITVAKMVVPCCGGIESEVKTALKNSEKLIPWQIVTISTDGKIIDF